jgi:hypothetical protein
VSSATPLEQRTLQARIEEAREKIAGLEKKGRVIDKELAALSEQRQQYQLLEQICTSLDKLEEMGAASLFWGDHPQAASSYVKRARSALLLFNEKITEIEQRRKTVTDRIQDEQSIITDLTYAIDDQQREQEELENEFVVHREVTKQPYRPVQMPWHTRAADDRRFKKALALCLLAVFMLGVATKLWVFPPRPAQEIIEIPKQVVMLAQQSRPKPPPPPPPEQQLREKSSEKPGTPSGEKQQARAKAEGAGVLAFKKGFADLLQDSPSLKLGADAGVSQGGHKALGTGERSLIAVQAREGSGGINTAALSRGVGVGGGGGGGGRVGGVQFTRVESSIGGGGGVPGGGRGLGDGPGPARTDEEIQIVFDRYKAALYRIYNRELRNDPTLKGKMVLRITIEPNGEVSACRIESTDLASAALKTEVVERVHRFNFGPKENVARITILYPIDFLPAT